MTDTITTEKVRRKRVLEGVVVSDKMQKTLVVEVESVKMHPKYHKRYNRNHRFKVHDEKEKYAVGNMVRFMECRPLSKEKRWRVIYT